VAEAIRSVEGTLGPGRDAPCPCGSQLAAGNCHVAPSDGRWVTPSAEPLLTDKRTGYGHPACYANASSDCSGKLTSEHWLSKNVLMALAPITISGMPWQQGGQDTVGVNSLGSNVLCERHNEALSVLDEVAGQVFRVLRDFQADLRVDPDPHGPEFALFDGPTIERWLLKMFWGAVAARALSTSSGPITSIPPAIPLAELAEALFRGGTLPSGSGMFISHRQDLFHPKAEVDISGFAALDGAIREGVVSFGPVGFRFSFGPPVPEIRRRAVRHPRGILMGLTETPEATTRQKVLALGWPDGGGNPVTVTRQGNGIVAAGPSDF